MSRGDRFRPVDDFMSDRDGQDWRGRFGDEPAQKADLVDLALYTHAETPKALLVSDNGDERRAKWVPKRFVEGSGQVLTMPEWLAKERGWL